MEDLRKVVADLKELGDKVDITYITYVAFCGLLSKKCCTNVFTQI